MSNHINSVINVSKTFSLYVVYKKIFCSRNIELNICLTSDMLNAHIKNFKVEVLFKITENKKMMHVEIN